MSAILIIDDELALVRSLSFALKNEGYAVHGAHTGAQGLAAVGTVQPAAVLLDLRLPDMSGLDVLDRLLHDQPELPVIMISAHGDTRAAVQAVKKGAADYLSKPFELDDLFHVIASVLERQRMSSEISFHRQAVVGSGELVGQSAAMRELGDTIGRVAASSSGRVLLLGESGTGKALVARAVHAGSARAGGPFIEVNCASLPEQLIEAELFGAEKGAYTGAHQKRTGLVALADGGTLFLDEIGELPLALQAKFLHFLEDGSYRPIGSGRALDTDVRVVAATNRDLAQEVRLGRFREDLYYRLNVIQLRIPPLRERGADIVELARHFAQRYAREEHCPPIRFSDETGQVLLAYPWPGNVRELKNLVERLTILLPGRLIVPSELPHEITATAPALAPPARFAVEANGAGARPIEHQLAAAERKLLEDALSRAGGQKGRAAEILGISRHALKRRLQRLGL
ncbi:sigma-54-dependent transcriptional regulator [Thauera chlorobenzoica]|uniref:Response regulator n=1 Tax=Thauera chlorobenzoica TaxID=96773 RepID=A0A1H5VGL4_9RHOO|nr:sigma-54 dependent transcriptional regulator [Thauera chlorobenzoica]APR05815.1 Response regulator [Thauera chlorobenzoica]SEF86186.1 DNA-binding transcriptional response regulator, NtrC family, contains REC, AAA-type ATPase, and a Fis-type DNA-binding domains [Thauera chlorobenzoica]